MSEWMSHSAPEPVFEHPWHAQAFALTVHLNERGRFTWGQWVTRFSATLSRHGLSKELNGGDDYFAAWLETLEAILTEEGTASTAEIDCTRADWEKAYLETPHGAPVKLGEG